MKPTFPRYTFSEWQSFVPLQILKQNSTWKQYNYRLLALGRRRDKDVKGCCYEGQNKQSNVQHSDYVNTELQTLIFQKYILNSLGTNTYTWLTR